MWTNIDRQFADSLNRSYGFSGLPDELQILILKREYDVLMKLIR